MVMSSLKLPPGSGKPKLPKQAKAFKSGSLESRIEGEGKGPSKGTEKTSDPVSWAQGGKTTAISKGVPKLGRTEVTNWAGTWKTESKQVFQPTNEVQLRQALRESEGELRFGGAKHSWSKGVKTLGTLIDMMGLNKVVKIDPKNMTVSAQPGIRMKDLYGALEKAGLALPMIPSSGDITLGGAIANAVHGSGLKIPASVADHASALTFIKTDGSGSVTLTHETKLAESLGAKPTAPDGRAYTDLELARTHLGSLGGLADVTLKVVPRYDVDVTVKNIPAEKNFGRLVDLVKKHDQHLFFWYPSVDRFQLETFTHVDPSKPTKGPAPKFSTQMPGQEPDAALERKADRLAKIPFGLGLKKWHDEQTSGKPVTLRKPWNIAGRESAEFRGNDVSYAVPLENAEQTLRDLQAMFKKNEWPEIPVWIRLVGKADSALNPAFDGPKAMIEYFPLQRGTMAHREKLMNDARAVFEENGGRRHWAKDGAGGVAKFPTQNVEAFAKLRKHLDPGARLQNEFTREM